MLVIAKVSLFGSLHPRNPYMVEASGRPECNSEVSIFFLFFFLSDLIIILIG